MQSSARKNGLEQGFHGFTLHSYLLCIGRPAKSLVWKCHAEWVGQGTGEQGTQVCEVCGWLPDSVQKQEKRREDDGKHCAIHHRKTVNPMFCLMGVICVPLYRRIFNRKRHSFHMKRNALRIPQSGNQERIIAYFLENDGQYIRDLAIRSLSEHFIVIILQYTHLNLILLNWMITSGVGRRMKLVTLKSPWHGLDYFTIFKKGMWSS